MGTSAVPVHLGALDQPSRDRRTTARAAVSKLRNRRRFWNEPKALARRQSWKFVRSLQRLNLF